MNILIFLLSIVVVISISSGQLISQSVATINDYVTTQNQRSIGGSLLTFSEIVRQKSNGNQVQQCPCVRPPGVNRCISYDSRFQGASIEEAILTFVDTSMDPRIFDDRIGGPIGSRSLLCGSEECRQCAAILAIRLRQIGLLQRAPSFSFPIPDFSQIRPSLCPRLRLSRTIPNLQPPPVVPTFVRQMVSAGLARIPSTNTTPRTAFGAAVAAAIRQARSVRGRPFFDVISRIRNQRIQNSAGRNNNNNRRNQGNNGNGGGGGGTRGISRPQQPQQQQRPSPRPQGQFPTFPAQRPQPRPQQSTPNNFPNRIFPQPQQQRPQQPSPPQTFPVNSRPQQPPFQQPPIQFPQQPQQPQQPSFPQIPIQLPQLPQQPQQPIFQPPIIQQPGGGGQQPPFIQQPVFQQPIGQLPVGQQPVFQQPGGQQPIFQQPQPSFPQNPQFPNGQFPQGPDGLLSPQGPLGSLQQPLGSAFSSIAQQGALQGFQHAAGAIPGALGGAGNPLGGGAGGVGQGGGSGGIGFGGGAGAGGGNPGGQFGSGGFGFGRKKRAADDGILGDRFVISCVERGDTENEASDYLNLCTACWTWRQLPPDYFPRLINELVCNEGSGSSSNDFCLSGWGSCHQRYRNVDVLRRGPNGAWQPTSISVATCCDCKVKAGTEVHALVIGQNKV